MYIDRDTCLLVFKAILQNEFTSSLESIVNTFFGDKWESIVNFESCNDYSDSQLKLFLALKAGVHFRLCENKKGQFFLQSSLLLEGSDKPTIVVILASINMQIEELSIELKGESRDTLNRIVSCSNEILSIVMSTDCSNNEVFERVSNKAFAGNCFSNHCVKRKVGIISGYYPGKRFPSSVNHFLYAQKHGYYYIDDSFPGAFSSKYFRKIESIKRYLGLFDWLFWIDDDAFFTDFSVSLESFIDSADGRDLIICSSPKHKKIYTRFSSGTFLIRNSSKSHDFLDDILSVDLVKVKEWWKDSYGYFTKGDQDVMVYLTMEYAKYNRRFLRVLESSDFNSRQEEYVKSLNDNFLVHFTGALKHEDYQDFVLKFNSNEFLAEKSIYEKYFTNI